MLSDLFLEQESEETADYIYNIILDIKGGIDAD